LKKNLLIFLNQLNFSNFDFDRYECKYLKKNFQLEIHNFKKIIYPNFIFNNEESFCNYRLCFFFSTFAEWKNYFIKKINKLNKIGVKIYALNDLDNTTFYSFRILRILKKYKIIRIDFKNPGLPQYNLYSSSFTKNAFELKRILLQIRYRPRYLYENFKKIIIRIILNKILEFFFKAKADFFLVAGNKYVKKLKKGNCKLIKFNTWDYSRFLRLQKYDKILKKNYAVYLANPGPDAVGDSQIFKTKNPHDPTNYYKKLNNFFTVIEKRFKLKIIIALHPKAKPIKRHSLLNFRRAFYNKTLKLVKNSKFVITYDSTSLIYAVLYNKPIYFVHNNESKRDPSSLKFSIFFANLLGCKAINIDEYKEADLKLIYSKRKYKNFIKDYATSTNKKINYKIISKTFK